MSSIISRIVFIFKACFHKTKAKLEKMPNERPFEFSEMYIFGKFDTFTRRLKKIIEIFDTVNLYAQLSVSKIEGKFAINSKEFPSILGIIL